MVEAALREARLGRPVLPIAPLGKTPITRHGLLDATTSEATIQGWWQASPDANLAIRTGADSGLVVVDVDGAVGAESLRALEKAHGALPRTASTVTPRGGQHFIFEHPGVEVRNSAGKLGPSLDVRGDGGYVLRPPSVGANGRQYEAGEEAEPAPLPEWLLRMMARPTDRPVQPAPASDWVTLVRDGIPEGRRNCELARLVGYLLRRDLHVDLVAEFVLLVNETSCRPPLGLDEVDRVIESIAALELRRRRGRHA